MARYIQDVTLNQPLDVVSEIMENYICRNRYYRTDWQGEPVYLSINSAGGGERYFKWSYSNGVIHMEAWMKGMFGEESGLSGGGKKQAYRESLESLIISLKNPPRDEYSHASYEQQGGYDHPQNGSDTPQPNASRQMPPNSQPVYMQPWMNSNGSRAPFVLPGKPGTTVGGISNHVESQAFGYGLAALCMAIIFPMFGLIFGIIGMQKSKAAIAIDPNTVKGKRGKVLSLIAIIIAVIMFFGSFFSPMLIMLFSIGKMY